MRISRRRFLELSAGAACGVATGCDSWLATSATSAADYTFVARPKAPSRSIASGTHALELSWARDGVIHVPPSYDPSIPAPLLVLLHGAGRNSSEWAAAIPDLVKDLGIIVVMPDSRAQTWDAVDGEFGPDVRFIDKALAFAFDRCLIDANRIALGGFSDGASYALSLGVANGDLFSALIGFSPGFVNAPAFQGQPRIFITHGTNDQVLPISNSRAIVPDFRAAGYDVTYIEFPGPHTVTRALARQAFEWLKTG